MRELNHKYDIDLSKMPVKAVLIRDKIEKLLRFAHIHSYELLKVDYNNGLIKLGFDQGAINLYSTTFTITVETDSGGKYPHQQHYKKTTPNLARLIFENPTKYSRQL